MGKVTNFSGQPVYNQLLNLLDKQKICKISQKTKKSESYVKKLDGYTHLVVMLYGVLKHFDSLRELEIGKQAEAHKPHHLGIDPGSSENKPYIPNVPKTVKSQSINDKE